MTVVAMVLSLGAILAQDVKVSGTVTDKTGDPVVGVKVLVEGTTTAASTDLEGRYTLTAPENSKLLFSSIGMRKKVVPVKGSEVINTVMKPADKNNWFFSIQAAAPNMHIKSTSLGFMLGWAKKAGWYVKGLASASFSQDMNVYDEVYAPAWLTGEYSHIYYAALGGVMVRLAQPLYIYFGVGYAWRYLNAQHIDGNYYRVYYSARTSNRWGYGSLEVDCGAMLKLGRFVVNAGILTSAVNFIGDVFDSNVVGNIGIGFSF